MKGGKVAQGNGKKIILSRNGSSWFRYRALPAGYLGVLGSTACSSGGHVVCSAPLPAAKPCFAAPPRLSLRRSRTYEPERDRGNSFIGVEILGTYGREWEKWRPAAQASTSMAGESGGNVGRSLQSDSAGVGGDAARTFKHETSASVAPTIGTQAGRRSPAESDRSGGSSPPLTNAVPSQSEVNPQQRLRQTAGAPSQLARSVSPSSNSAQSTVPRQPEPFRATGTRQREAGGRMAPVRDKEALSATAHGSDVSKKNIDLGDASLQTRRRHESEQRLEGNCTRGGYSGGEQKATSRQAVREGLKGSTSVHQSTTTFAGVAVAQENRDRVAEGRLARRKHDVVTPRSPKKRPPGLPFRASKARAWHSQQAVQSAMTPAQAMRAVLDRPLRANYITVSTALNRVAKLTAERGSVGLATDEERKFLGTLLEVTEELVASGAVNARNLAQLLWSLGKLGNLEVYSGYAWRHAEEGLRKTTSPESFGEDQRNKDKGRLPALLAGRLSEKAYDCKPVELAMAAWGLAMLGERDEACLSAIAREVSLRAHEFRGQELGNVAWALAVLGYRNKDMLEAIAEVLSPEPLQWHGRVTWEWKESRVGKNGESGAWKASIDRSWSCGDQGEAGRPAAELAAVAAVAEAAADRDAKRDHGTTSLEKGQVVGLDEHRRMEIGPNSTGGVAVEGCDGGEGEAPGKARTGEGGSQSLAFTPDATRSKMLIAKDSPSATSVTAAASTDTSRSAELSSGAASPGKGEQQAAGGDGVGDVGSTSVRDHGNGVGGGSASAASGAAQDRGRGECAKEVEVASVALTPQDLALLCWGFSSISQEWLPGQPAAYRALSALAAAARKCVGSLWPQDISMVSLALARLSWDDPELMKAMMARAVENLQCFKPQELSNMAWACARLHVQYPRFWSSVQAQAKRILAGPGMKAQEIANLAWSLAVMGEADSVLLSDLFRSAQAQRSDLTAVESHQLYQVYLLWQDDIPGLWRELDEGFLQELRRRWNDNQERMKRSSHNHLEVSEILELMQISHENESEHDIDIEIVGVGLASEDWDFRSFATGAGPNPADPAEVRLKLALEVDGPAHFTKNTARPLGHMVLKHRTLAKMGWTVVSIPFLEWDPIPFWSSMEKKRYLQRKLGITRTIFFGGIDCSNFKGWSTRLGKTSRYH